MKKLKKLELNLCLTSDASGETVVHIGDAVMAQFQDVKVEKFFWPMIRSYEQIDIMLKAIKYDIVIFSMVDKDISKYLVELCSKKGIYCVSAISEIANEISKYLNVPLSNILPGKQHNIDESYFQKMAAINYTIHHDDGKYLEEIKEADILILGVSRTSKSPSSLYLAQRGYKVANIPIVKGVDFPIDLTKYKKVFQIGFTVHHSLLTRIREDRLQGIKVSGENIYTNPINIKEEIKYAEDIYKLHNIPTIDISYRSVEEISAEVIMLLNEKKEDIR